MNIIPTIKTPYISKELVDYLTQIFPDQCPPIDMPDRQVWAQVGKVEVVRHIQMLHTRQAQDGLTKVLQG